MKETVKVEIRKPLYGNFAYVNASILDRAIREGKFVEISLPNGTAVVDPSEWKKTGKIMKKVFKYPDNPMVLYGNHVPIKKEDHQQKLI